MGELLQQLHDVGCERDRAGNRSLHMDQDCILMLLCMFKLVVTSYELCRHNSKWIAQFPF